jgi:glucosamine--fructose-6-phosphate aminotransferase (isomerizing)
MCGIVAIIGNYDISTIIKCLYNLQNRGYDSAGISFINDTLDTLDNFIYKRELNKQSIENLLNYTLSLNNNIKFNNCISHTRWATHGGISLNNCHPHFSNNGKISLVHNGIIENYNEIKNFLIENNFTFYSQTDSEVIVNLIQFFLENEKQNEKQNENLLKNAIFKTISKLIGTFGLVIQYLKEPNILYAIKRGSPLLIGKSNLDNNFTIVTSETSGFNNLVNNYHELLTENLYIINKDNDNFIINKKNENIVIEYDILNIKNIEYSLGEFKHYTQKEIYEQNNIIKLITHNGARIKNNKIVLGGLTDYYESILNCDNLILFGCGTSFHACLYSIYHFKKLCNFKNVIAIDACDFNEYLLPKGNNCYIFISQSGETKDLFSVLDKIKNNKYLNGITIGVINVVDSLIARTVDCGVYLNIGKEMSVASTKVFLAQSLVLVLISLFLNQNIIETNKYINDIRNLEQLINIELNKEISIDNFNNGYILASNTLFPIAMEAALKFKEITYSHIEPLSINSLKHGPLALVSEENFVNIILGNHESAKQEILARNGKVINIQINYDNIFNDLLYIIHLQRYNYLLSIQKGINPDFPRNLAKVVTV